MQWYFIVDLMVFLLKEESGMIAVASEQIQSKMLRKEPKQTRTNELNQL